jgi:hypothetical protein
MAGKYLMVKIPAKLVLGVWNVSSKVFLSDIFFLKINRLELIFFFDPSNGIGQKNGRKRNPDLCEKLGMCSEPGRPEFKVNNRIDEKPVRLNMALPEILPRAFEFMILRFWR